MIHLDARHKLSLELEALFDALAHIRNDAVEEPADDWI
jgi:hypothetical protein